MTSPTVRTALSAAFWMFLFRLGVIMIPMAAPAMSPMVIPMAKS